MNFKFAIDPGHGLDNKAPGKFDPGAVSGTNREADIALAWALTFKFVAGKQGVETWLTRSSNDESAPLSQRMTRAAAAGCTHYIALHCDASEKSEVCGSTTFFRDQQDRKFAGLALASAEDAYKAAGQLFKSRGCKPESSSQHKSLAVFGFNGPATLLELGFITNQTDLKVMLSRDARIAFAESLLRRLTNG